MINSDLRKNDDVLVCETFSRAAVRKTFGQAPVGAALAAIYFGFAAEAAPTHMLF